MQEGGNTNFNGQPNFSQFQNQQFTSQSPIISQQPVYLNEPAKKSKKPLIITLIILVVISAIIGVIFLLNPNNKDNQNNQNNQNISSKEASMLIRDLYDDYSNLLSMYVEIIGYTPSLKIDEYRTIFPATQGFITETKNNIESIKHNLEILKSSSVNNIAQDKKQTLNNLIENISKNINIVSDNIDKISEYYDAFIYPFYNFRYEELSCDKTDKMKEAILLDKELGELYYDLYCFIITESKNNTLVESVVIKKAKEASDVLNSQLKTVDNQNDFLKQIEKFSKDILNEK